MTTAVVPKLYGLTQAMLEILRTGGYWDTPTVCLYTNALVPTFNTVLADLTEASFAGYARQTIASWGTIGDLGDGIHIYSSNLAVATFQYTGLANSGNIYGTFGLDTTGLLLWVDNPASPPTILLPGQKLFYSPTAYLRSEY